MQDPTSDDDLISNSGSEMPSLSSMDSEITDSSDDESDNMRLTLELLGETAPIVSPTVPVGDTITNNYPDIFAINAPAQATEAIMDCVIWGH